MLRHRDVEPHDRGGIGDHRRIRAGVVGDFQPAFDDPHGSRAVRQHRQHRLLVHPLGAGNADRDLDLHRIDRQSDGIGDAERVVPQRVAQRAHRGLGVIRAADIGSHADLQHHSLQGHFVSLPRSVPGFDPVGLAPGATSGPEGDEARAGMRRIVDGEEALGFDRGIALGRRQAGVAQQFLDRAQIAAGAEKMRRKAVPQRVRGRGVRQAEMSRAAPPSAAAPGAG